MAARYKAKIETPHGLRTCFEARVHRDGKKDLVARFGGIPLALLLFLWVGSGALRRVRGRSSQVKGACGVAAARALRAPLDLRASAAPSGRACGQAGGLPGRVRSAPEPRPGGWPPVKIVE